MQITQTNKKVHPLMQNCHPSVVAFVLAVASLTVWGLALPMTLVAQAQSVPDGRGLELPPQSFESGRPPMPPAQFDSSTHRERDAREQNMATSSRPASEVMKKENKQNKENKMMFATRDQQNMAKQRVQNLVAQLNAFKKQVANLSAQGVTVPATLGADVEQVLKDIKELGQSVASSQIKPKQPNKEARKPAVPPPIPTNPSSDSTSPAQ